MYRVNKLILAVVAASCAAVASVGSAQQRATIELEVLIEQGFPIDQQHRWMEMLGQVGADRLRLRSSGPNEPVAVQQLGTLDAPLYKITARLSSRQRLGMPGGTFGIGDRAAIAAQLDALRADGPDVALAEKKAFGLTAQQLVDVHTELAVPYEQSTMDQTSAHVVQQVSQQLKMRVVTDAQSNQALQGDFAMRDELQGLSCGTVLAVALRPLGLVAVPQRKQGESIELRIADSRNADEHWPIGWPPQRTPLATAPKLFEKLDVKIADFPLGDALQAVQQKVGIPFVYDWNSLARRQVNLNDAQVSLEEKQLTYYRVVQLLLSKSRLRLKLELRTDEAEQPFLWISARQ